MYRCTPVHLSVWRSVRRPTFAFRVALKVIALMPQNILNYFSIFYLTHICILTALVGLCIRCQSTHFWKRLSLASQCSVNNNLHFKKKKRQIKRFINKKCTNGYVAWLLFQVDFGFFPRLSECGGFFNASSGTITSWNYPNNYIDNLRCVYHIRAPNGYHVCLSFEDFEQGTGDTLKIGNDKR